MVFKIGDQVLMKSGGPIMTVHAINADGQHICRWFDGDQKLWSNHFVVDTLIAYRQEPSRNTWDD